MEEVIVLGRPYILTYLSLLKTRSTVKGYVYDRYVINVPRALGERLNPRGEKKVFLLAYITRPPPYYLLNLELNDPVYWILPEEARKELYYHYRDPAGRPKSRVVFIAAEEDELRELGLDPTKPITLRDVIEALKSRNTG